MASPDINPPADNAHGAELPPRMPLGQPGAHGGDPNSDAAWVSQQAASQIGEPTHDDKSYAEMTHNPPGAGTHGNHPYDEYKHAGREA
jgi:hypothetical protein